MALTIGGALPNRYQLLVERLRLVRWFISGVWLMNCVYCGQIMFDLHAISGRRIDPHWATKEGDFGCDLSPQNTNEGVGEHEVKL